MVVDFVVVFEKAVVVSVCVEKFVLVVHHACVVHVVLV